jgi:hypothetical protein
VSAQASIRPPDLRVDVANVLCTFLRPSSALDGTLALG